MTTDQKDFDAKVVALFVREPETTLTAAAHQLGCSVWEVRKACYRAGISLKVGRKKKSDSQRVIEAL